MKELQLTVDQAGHHLARFSGPAVIVSVTMSASKKTKRTPWEHGGRKPPGNCRGGVPCLWGGNETLREERHDFLDTSFTIRATMPSEEQQRYTDLMTQWKEAGQQLCAPTLWLYEVASTFTKMAHFKQLSWEDSQRSMRFAFQLGIQLIEPDEQLAMRAWTWSHRLQRASAYDSFYWRRKIRRGGGPINAFQCPALSQCE
ncbi:MAG: type II toxin-antitoxin system VapC family toxin [Chloroflexi bacterium]|nr:type II toxin-antitoxin system VapC family toxin [Chloroflexota bacterium]